MGFIAGGYTATYNSLTCGQTATGFRTSHSFNKEIVTGDKFAQSPQDAVFQGAEVTVSTTFIEYNAAAMQILMWPYGTGLFNQTQPVGVLDDGSSLVKAMLLSAVAGTPAENTPASVSFVKAIIAENAAIDLDFAPRLRVIPWRGRVYLDTNGLFATVT